MDIVGCGWKMMSPTVRFKAYHCLKRSDLKSRKIWGKDGPCSTWPSLDSLQTGTVQPFRGWIQVFSPNHPPKKVAAGYQWFLAYPNIKSITHPDGCGYPCHHGILWWTQQNSWWMDVPHVHPFKIRYNMDQYGFEPSPNLGTSDSTTWRPTVKRISHWFQHMGSVLFGDCSWFFCEDHPREKLKMIADSLKKHYKHL